MIETWLENRSYFAFLRKKEKNESWFPFLSFGRLGIRTLDTVARIHVLQTCAFDRSANLPLMSLPRPGVEPGLQSSQDCVLSTERPEQRNWLYESSRKKQVKAEKSHFFLFSWSKKIHLFFLRKKNSHILWNEKSECIFQPLSPQEAPIKKL